MYKIMLIVGIIGSVITFISTTILFFKCNVIEIVKDLTGIKIVKKKEVTLSGVTDNSLTKIKTSISTSTSTSKVKSGNEEEKIKNKGIIKETKSNDRYKSIETEIVETKETELLYEETDLLEEETNILEEETGLLEEETNILDEETGLFEEDTDLLEEVLKDGEYVKEIDVVVVNYTSIIDI